MDLKRIEELHKNRKWISWDEEGWLISELKAYKQAQGDVDTVSTLMKANSKWEARVKELEANIEDPEWCCADHKRELVERIKELEEIVTLAIESQGWDGNNPDDERWTEFYKKAKAAIANRD